MAYTQEQIAQARACLEAIVADAKADPARTGELLTALKHLAGFENHLALSDPADIEEGVLDWVRRHGCELPD